jgi:hypothetical protein
MQLKPFLLDAWLDQYEHDTEFFFSKTSSTDITISARKGCGRVKRSL